MKNVSCSLGEWELNGVAEMAEKTGKSKSRIMREGVMRYVYSWYKQQERDKEIEEGIRQIRKLREEEKQREDLTEFQKVIRQGEELLF